jgi:hypothetical protein
MIRFLSIIVVAVLISPSSRCGEGLWIPLLIDSLNYPDMKEKGLMLLPDEIYSTEQPSLKDAVVIFGNGCTGEVISPNGLVITNHHCGYSRIQSHSTIEKNYLNDGFWAGSREDELSNPGLTVSFLKRIEDVTQMALLGVPDSFPERERNGIISANLSEIRTKAIEGSHYVAEVKPFFFGRKYYLFVYEIFRDIRLVGAPPESIGSFGGDTDNWMWPRHTGDFSLFRIYANKSNEPADYSPDNVPYKPQKYLNISTDGVKEGDFTMVMGYPGRTDEYLTSYGLELIAKKSLPAKIEMRTLRLKALSNAMSNKPELKLKYASKYKSISNAWKKWIGVTSGIDRSGAINKKKLLEEAFSQWSQKTGSVSNRYSGLMQEFNDLYTGYEPLYLTIDLGNELMNSVDIFDLAGSLQTAVHTSPDSSDNYKTRIKQRLKQRGNGYFTSGALAIDKQVMPDLLRIYAENTDPVYHPAVFTRVRNEFNNDFNAYSDYLFGSSMFTDSARFNKVLKKPMRNITKRMSSDPVFGLYRDMSSIFLVNLYGKVDSMNLELNRLYRKYLTGLMEMDTARIFYPDANFTMRVTYGKVEGYNPSDAVVYSHFTTLNGLLEKEDPENADYKVPAQIKDLAKNRDFGPYTAGGEVPVCFIASNHTSGGNSGSPVLNARGDLIGINFDRNWEGTVSDFAYDPSVCRNISLDVRYVLFVIDKVADADWLLNELTIINK